MDASAVSLAERRRSGRIHPHALCRHRSRRCGSALWVWDPHWPELVHPFASAIDVDLPVPPERTHLLLDSKANWVPVHADPGDKQFGHYPDESIAEWHQRLDLEC